MKDKKWFKEACYQYAQTTESLVDFIERIYTQGRADQNEYVRKKLNAEFYFRRGPNCEEQFLAASEIESIVLAAGPEVGE